MSKVSDLESEVAELEVELERRDKVSRERYAALERDRDLVENAMREASARAQRNEDNLKAVLTREETLKVTLREAQTNLEATRAQLRKMTAARDTACAESASRLREIMAADARADVWQAAAQDALDQMARWRKQAKEQTKLCDMTVDIDLQHTGTVATLAKVAKAVTSQSDKGVRRG